MGGLVLWCLLVSEDAARLSAPSAHQALRNRPNAEATLPPPGLGGGTTDCGSMDASRAPADVLPGSTEHGLVSALVADGTARPVLRLRLAQAADRGASGRAPSRQKRRPARLRCRQEVAAAPRPASCCAASSTPRVQDRDGLPRADADRRRSPGCSYVADGGKAGAAAARRASGAGVVKAPTRQGSSSSQARIRRSFAGSVATGGWPRTSRP